MGKTKSIDGRRILFLYGIIITAWMLAAPVGSQLVHAVFSFDFPDQRLELGVDTTTDYRFDQLFPTVLQEYSEFAWMYQEQGSSAIPGLSYTQVGDAGSACMVPQGICIAGDYMLITAYDNGGSMALKWFGNYEPVNSVIYVLSYEEGVPGDYLTTIVLPDVNHAGGITFDGSRIWIAKSTSGYCSTISYEEIQKAVASDKPSYELAEYQQEVYCGVTASSVSYYDGCLWIETFCTSVVKGSSANVFRIIETESGVRLDWKQELTLPACTQGIAFYQDGQKTYAAVTTSWSRYQDSIVYLYELEIQQEEQTRQKTVTYHLQQKGKYHFPPMAEELVSDGEHTYVLFESGASCYSTQRYNRCSYPIDRVCALSNQQLFSFVSDN